MSRLHLSLVLAGMLAVSSSGFEAIADTPAPTTPGPRAGAAAYRQGEVIVKLRPQTRTSVRKLSSGRVSASGSTALAQLLTKYGVNDAEQLMPLTGKALPAVGGPALKNLNGPKADDLSKLYCLEFDASQDVQQFVEELKQLPDVEFAEPNYIVYSTGFSNPSAYTNEPLYSTQWGIPAVGLDKLWKVPVTAERRSVIAILDTGVDIEHPDLKDNIWTNTAELEGSAGADDDNNGFADDVHGYDFVNKTGRMRDNNGHGTHCAGIAGATGNNGVGICGANPDALIMPVTVMQSNGTGDVATIIKGIDYAAANGADVISMSFGSYAHSIAEEQALGKAYQKAVLVAAAGNDKHSIYPFFNIPGPMFPAAYSFVLGVQASHQAGGLAEFSNYDNDGAITSTFSGLWNYELTAPGAGIISTFPGGQYRSLNGTSMATPLVAGAISRLLSVKDYSSKEELFGDLIYTSKGYIDKPAGNIDIYGAYQITEADRRPTLSLVTYRIDDSDGGDGDNRPDAGETIRIYPTLRNQWGNARNITYSIKLADLEDPTIAEFIDADARHTLPVLSSYATAETLTPFAVKISPDCVDGRHIKFVLTATCDNISEPLEQEIVLTAENGVEIGGILREDMTLTPDKNYIVTSLLGVPEGRTLTILPGTTIKFKDGTGLSVATGGKVIANGEPGKMITFTKADLDLVNINKLDFGNYNELPLNYIVITDLNIQDLYYSYLKNSIISYNKIFRIKTVKFEKSNIINLSCNDYTFKVSPSIYTDCNIINHLYEETRSDYLFPLKQSTNTNVFNNIGGYLLSKIIYSGEYFSNTPNIYTPEQPNYFGSARQDIVQPTIWDIKNPLSDSFGEYDLSNMLTRPSAEAHGIVWKVVVNGYDAQDEYETLPPLGVGRHKFEVYFNRPMNKAKAPMIAMGVREPYTQTAIGEDGAWNEAGDIYTAYLTITGRDKYDGVNTIYVADAEDDEFFPIPIENYRFRVNVQSAGSMSAGFTAEPGLGKVTLTWENPEENVSDLLGYNLYRYTVDDEQNVSDTLRINPSLLDKEEFTDFDVTPGTTYCYYYKVMTTALTENSPSKTVATTPLTSIKGDANGTMAVDVADIVTEVGYMLGQNPQPFIFDAADVNSDTDIDVLDVVGTVNIITGVTAPTTAAIASTVGYFVEDGILYVDTPVDIAGVQVKLTGVAEDAVITPMESLEGFETMGSRGKEDDYTFLAFSLSGKKLTAGIHALLNIGDNRLASIVLSDNYGRNLPAEPVQTMGIGDVTADSLTPAWPNPFATEINVPFAIAEPGSHEVKITLTALSGQTVGAHTGSYGAGSHSAQLRTDKIGAGFYLLNIYVDGIRKATQKVIKL